MKVGIKVFLVCDRSGEPNIYTTSASEKHSWILAAQSVSANSFDLVKNRIAELKRDGYVCKRFLINHRE